MTEDSLRKRKQTETSADIEDETNDNTETNQNENIKDIKTPSKHTGSQTSAQSNAIGRRDSNRNLLILFCIIGVSLGILTNVYNVFKTRQCVKKYIVYDVTDAAENRNGVLKHVHRVLERVGYEMSKPTHSETWDLLWAHAYPFNALRPNLYRLKPGQKVNHFPGSWSITLKVNLSTSGLRCMPRAFRLPEQKEEFLQYASSHPQAMFLQKNTGHRGVRLRNVSEVDTQSEEHFVQEYVARPLLVDGRRFDMGVYVLITSVNPLRVYWYKGDVLFRYCPEKYHPFDPANLDKYVVGDDYMPTWEVPSLAARYRSQGLGMKDSFDDYLREQGKDPEIIWKAVLEALREMFLANENNIIQALKWYSSGDNFFELMRVDLVADEDLRVWLLEANMSPNLSSAHFPPNQLLYEQVLYNLFSLVGVSSPVRPRSMDSEELQATSAMVSSLKNIAVPSVGCGGECGRRCDAARQCALCPHCARAHTTAALLRAHTEHLHRGDFARLYPPPMEPNTPLRELQNTTESNKIMFMWYQAKCNIDPTWCT